MEALFAKATQRAYITQGIIMIGERHGLSEMQRAAAIFHELWMKEDGTSVRTSKYQNRWPT